jgi:GntR family transcriptional regulator
MLSHVDRGDSLPIYRQVADEVKALIASGRLSEGEPLPPLRQVAADLGVNLNTIATAYRKLQDEGLIEIRHGSGAVVSSRTIKETARPKLAKPLRAALTQLVLAGIPRSDIVNLVAQQLYELTMGGK